ncbi:MAG: DPP IV N-terminal domain-containing protein [Ferruginibacter sp.]|nr:DPP IV N-terminal domain-containing protein [Bacteroidota bacterium]MBX2918448.1 DPP IV N-terminal domain-containing protein [Ferruginibacter sp.]
MKKKLWLNALSSHTVKQLCGSLMLLFFYASAHSQLYSDTSILKPLPRITGWADNEHYIVQRYNREQKKDISFLENSKTGAEKEYVITNTQLVAKAVAIDGDIFVVAGKDKKRITNTDAEEKLPLLSPDKKWIAFLRNNDLFAIELATSKEIRFTNDGTETILNGYASWVYYEEILGRSSEYRAFWWSPGSKHIAFYRFDESKVPVFPLYNSTGQHGFTENTRFPKAGDPNPEVNVGIASLESAKVQWADFNQQDDQYFGTPIWRPDGSGILIQWMPREQNNLKLYDIDLTSGAKKEIYSETQSTWVSWINRFKWIKNGFLMIRDFDGWEQIYYHAADGRLIKKITSGKNWRTEIEKFDEQTQTLYYTANAEKSTRTDLYSVQLNGTKQKRLTFGEYSHAKTFLSPNNRHLITTYSNSYTPTRMALVDLKTGKRKDIADSKGSKYDSSKLKRREIVWLKTDDGFELPGRIVWPVNLEQGKKYPVTINVYGGPNYQAVSDEWVNSLQEEDTNPVIEVGFAHRGSGDFGKQGLNFLHRNLGKWEMADYIAWIKWLRKNPFVDTSKIMIAGGSYGGYLTAMALTYGAEFFKYGISSYPVTDWLLYDSHYTERYMDLPKDNPEGYRFGSVMTHVGNYQNYGPSMLLLQHGTMDDNVHIQNTYQLADTLQMLNKPFELMVYPGQRHGFLGPKSRFVLKARNSFKDRYLFNNN